MKQSKGFCPRTKHVICEFLVANGSPTALGLYLCLRHGDLRSAVSHNVHPEHFEDSEEFASAYCAQQALSKLENIPAYTVREKRDNAITLFRDIESAIPTIERTLRRIIYRPELTDLYAHNALCIARDKIYALLRTNSMDEPYEARLDTDEWLRSCRFGPGSSTSQRGGGVCQTKKMSASEIDCTSQLIPFMRTAVSGTAWERTLRSFSQRESSVIITVPKNSKTDRVINIEPDANIFMQLGLGAMLRRRLKRVGIDLDKGHLRNAEKARLGSIDSSYGTIDLSSASDRITPTLVEFLLPPAWYHALCLTRSTAFELDGVTYPTRKFSAMGNGYTFELQSLIFWSLACSVTEQYDDVAVYGDDIIVPGDSYTPLCTLLSELGMVVNAKKSFGTGYFRESCGAHFFNGRDVKPIYFRDNLNDEESVYKTANALRRYTRRSYGVCVTDSRYRGTYKIFRELIPQGFLIPDGVGDGGFCVPVEEAVDLCKAANLLARERGWQGRYVKARVARPFHVYFDGEGALVSELFTLYRRRGWIQEDQEADHPETGVKVSVRPLGRVRTRPQNIWVSRWLNP